MAGTLGAAGVVATLPAPATARLDHGGDATDGGEDCGGDPHPGSEAGEARRLRERRDAGRGSDGVADEAADVDVVDHHDRVADERGDRDRDADAPGDESDDDHEADVVATGDGIDAHPANDSDDHHEADVETTASDIDPHPAGGRDPDGNIDVEGTEDGIDPRPVSNGDLDDDADGDGETAALLRGLWGVASSLDRGSPDGDDGPMAIPIEGRDSAPDGATTSAAAPATPTDGRNPDGPDDPDGPDRPDRPDRPEGAEGTTGAAAPTLAPEDGGDPDGTTGPGTAAAPASGDPLDPVTPSGGFWDLAKKGLAAWGHEPTVDEMVGYWRGLIDDMRWSEDAPGDGTTAGTLSHLAPTPEPADAPGAPSPPGDLGTPEIHDTAADPRDGGSPLVVNDDLEDTIETDTIDLDDTVELDELVELAGLADMAVLTDPGRAVPPSDAHVPSGTTTAPPPGTGGAADHAASPGTADDARIVPLLALPAGDTTGPTASPDAAAAAGRSATAGDGSGDRATTTARDGSGDRPMTTAGEGSGDRATTAAGEGSGDGAMTAADPERAPSAVRSAAHDAAAHGAGGTSEEEPGEESSRPVGLAGGGLAFAGCLTLVDRRRRAQQRHRPAGRQIAMPAAPLDAYERELRDGADRAAASLVDLALRAAAAGAGEDGLPPLRWVEASPGAVTLVLDAPRPAPTGFAPADGTGWTTAAPAGHLAERAAPALPPVPSLVPLGTTAGGRELLVDLASTGPVTVDGPPGDVRGLLRAAAVSLATAPWCEPLHLVVAGMDPEIGALPGVRAVDDLDTALTIAGTRNWPGSDAGASLVIVSGAAPEDAGTQELLATVAGDADGRVGLLLRHPGPTTAGDSPTVGPLGTGRPSGIGDAAGEAPSPAAEATEPAAATTGAGPESRAGAGGGSPVAGGDVASGIGGLAGVRRLRIDRDGTLQGEGLLPDVRARRLDEVETAALVALLDCAHRDAHGPPLGRGLAARRPAGSGADADGGEGDGDGEGEGDGDDGPAPTTALGSTGSSGAAEPRPGVDALLAGAEVLVRVLGDVEAVRIASGSGERAATESPLDDPDVPEALEVVTFLALSASPVSYGSLQVNLCLEGTDGAGTLDAGVDAARRLLGDDLLPAPTRGRYALSGRVVTDYGILCALLAQADAAADPEREAELLTAAAELVRGVPLSGPGQGYAWAGPPREAMVARVVDLAERLARHRLDTRDWSAAAWAAWQGLRALPCDERLHRVLMRSAHGGGDLTAVHQAFEALCDAIADPDTGVEPDDTLHPETVELLEQLATRRPRPDQPPKGDAPGGDRGPGAARSRAARSSAEEAATAAGSSADEGSGTGEPTTSDHLAA